jgi:hypothetical protein
MNSDNKIKIFLIIFSVAIIAILMVGAYILLNPSDKDAANNGLPGIETGSKVNAGMNKLGNTDQKAIETVDASNEQNLNQVKMEEKKTADLLNKAASDTTVQKTQPINTQPTQQVSNTKMPVVNAKDQKAQEEYKKKLLEAASK